MLSSNSQPRQVLVINVGDELLDGIRENGHLLWLGEHLARRGLPITRSIVVRDNAKEIAREVGEAWGAYDLIVTTGGIGPTSDDYTRAAIASALGLKLEHVPAAEVALRERFKMIGRKLSEADLSQCFIPAGAEALPTPRGTAPGVCYHRDGKALVMLPGPTLELRPMFEEEVVPRLRDVGCACQGEAYVQVRTFGIGAVPLEAIVRPFLKPGMVLSFGTHTGVVDARISSAGSGFTADDLCHVARQVRDAVGHDFVCTGHACLASLVVEQLRSLERTGRTNETFLHKACEISHYNDAAAEAANSKRLVEHARVAEAISSPPFASACQRQHTSAYVRIRPHTSAYVRIRPHTSACTCRCNHQEPPIRQCLPAY
jgi:nicotinamide-nucleotide amidase